MDKKFTIEDIAAMLAEKTGEETAAVETFLKELIAVINEGVIRDQSVKVKGIGTFKIVLVKERESVSVSTGERIIIPPHHKLSFIPEKTLKELINKPFASFEAIETVGEDSGLMNYTLSENAREDESDNEPENETKVEEAIVYQEPPRPLSDREIIEQMQEENLVSTPPPLRSSESQPPPPPHRHERKAKRIRKRKSKRSSTKLLLAILFCLLFILIGGGCWYFFFYNKSMDEFYTERFNNRIPEASISSLPADSVLSNQEPEESPAALDSTTNVQVEIEIEKIDTTKTEVPAQIATPVSEPTVSRTVPRTAPPPPTTTNNTNNVLARVTMESGQRLTLISEKYYGLKVFWVYIYEYNKAKIGSNPDRIPIGMEILVPAKEIYEIDATSTASVERATALQRRIMAGY